ncbi:MAG: riboflavin biosynthesis protein RibF [Anaerolineales bacterium]|nr:riboflavin biosynthesis protein RibF [Anaerolineales bacterium]
MQHVHDLSSLNLDGCGLTIGSFDGVHLGHQALVKAMVADARTVELPAVVVTFFPRPSVVIRDQLQAYYVTLPDEKAALLGELGVDYVITQHFDKALSHFRADAFLSSLQRHLRFRRLWIGEDFALGYQREGDRAYLKTASESYGFQLHVFPPIKTGEQAIRSSLVRQALQAGDVSRVRGYLGRSFALSGKVVIGAGRGKELGFPTANLQIHQEQAYPGPGVYACFAEVSGERWVALTNIGVRPTFEISQSAPTIEAHLLDFTGDLYQQEMRLTFIERLRDEQRFPGPEALQVQIRHDIQRAHTILVSELEGEDV